MRSQMTLIFDAYEYLPCKEDGHYHLLIPTFYDHNSPANAEIDFVFDTGAYLTVISRDTAYNFGFLDRFTIQPNVPINGFSGGCMADMKEIPGLIVGGRRLEGVKVAVPHIDTDMDILGLNVIEHFKYFVDTENDMIYFAENPNPEIPDLLKPCKIHAISVDNGVGSQGTPG